MTKRILLLDDDPFSQRLVQELLRAKDVDLTVVDTVEKARKAFSNADFNLAILDQRLPDGNGLDLFAEWRRQRPHLIAILITGYADVRDAVRAVREGLFDYLTKPFETIDELEAVIEKALEMDGAYREIAGLKQALSREAQAPIMSSRSPVMEAMYVQMRQVAPLDTTVLIEGESGTGKEVLAKALHAMSQRNHKPWKELNCGALPEPLLEASLFGYEKGAFTGAAKATAGYFEDANDGTIFLDEIGEMSPKLQVSLLRVLQDGSFARLGSTVQRYSNFRLICATNKPLNVEMQEGRFRPDLYYRINVVALEVPPLRRRPEDILPLALFFVELFSRKFGRPTAALSPEAVRAIETAFWPGNVRQLKHAIERAVAVNGEGPITAASLALPQAPAGAEMARTTPLPYREARQQFESEYFSRLLEFTEGNVSESSRLSGLARQNIYTHLRQAGIDMKS